MMDPLSLVGFLFILGGIWWLVARSTAGKADTQEFKRIDRFKD